MNLKSIVEEHDTRAGHLFDIAVQVAIVISIISFSVETLPDLDAGTQQLLDIIEVVTVALFTAEYLLRIWVADSKPGYIFSFYGLIDLAAILPFYLASGVDLRTLRVLRMFRLFRLFKMFRYSHAIWRFGRAFEIAKEEIVLFSIVTMMLLYLSAVGIYYFENAAQPENFKSIFHSLWWAVATLTTVGYGDVYPVTLGGRIFTFFILMVGLGIVAVPAGLLASALLKVRTEEMERKKASGSPPPENEPPRD